MPYQGRQPGVGVRNRFIFTATSGQTSFSGADSNGLTLKYPDATYTDVFLNGALLIPVTDYAATTGTSIVLSSGAATSDVLEVVAYEISSIANAVPTSGGTFTGPVTVQGNFTADGGTVKLDGNYPVGTNNVALGNTALDSLTSGIDNTALGSAALTANTSGNENTVVGYVALAANTTGSSNTAFGRASLYANTTASYNSAYGTDSLQVNTTGSSNTAVGHRSLFSNTTASHNTAVGYKAGYSNTQQHNAFVGYQAGMNATSGGGHAYFGSQAGESTTTGADNTALGTAALVYTTTGSYNTAVGKFALLNNTTASNNTAVGYKALYANTTGTSNNVLGYQAGQANTTGGSNTAMGHNTFSANTTGFGNSAFGIQTLYRNTTANYNTAMGYVTLENNTTGTENVAIGGFCLDTNTTGSYNTALGNSALQTNTTANNNTAIGYQAGFSATGGNNTLLGAYAGYYITSGTNNTIIGEYNGNQGGLDIRTSSNNIVLSDGDGNPRALFDSSGNLRIGNFATGTRKVQIESSGANYTLGLDNTHASAPYGIYVDYSVAAPNGSNYEFFVGLDSSATRVQIFSSGNIVNANNSYGAISDVKLKENIIDASSQWDDIKALTVRKYSMKSDELDAPNRLGVIAQELEAAGMGGLVNESADKDKDLNDLGTTTKSVNYSILYMKAVKALQEAMDRIETLEADVAALKNP